MTNGLGAGAAVGDALEQRLLGGGAEIRKIFFRNLAVDVEMGVHAHEKGRVQPVHINIVLYLAADTAPRRDAIDEVFDYDRVRDGILRAIGGRHINLQETLVEEIAKLCLGFDEVLAVRVSNEKLDVYPDCDGVGFELVRIKE